MPPAAVFLAYDLEAPSFRHRLRDVAARLTAEGWEVTLRRLPKGRYFSRLLAERRALAAAAVAVLSKVNLGLGEGALLRRLAARLVVDFDDAIYLRRPRRLGDRPGESCLRSHRFERTCAAADVVLAGNETLAARARRGAPRVEVVPTSVDVASYPAAPPRRGGRVVVWIGRPENVAYLELLRPAVATLARELPDLTLRVVSSRFPDWPEARIEAIPWSERTEVEALMSADVGVMPLADDAWTRGKCGFKLLQYMAASLPTVASPVGANLDVVVPGVTGFFAAAPGEWTARLRELLTSTERREAMGRAGHEAVRQRFDRPATVARVVSLLREVAARGDGA